MKNANLQTSDLERLSQLLDSLNQAKKDRNEKAVIEEKIMEFFRQTGIKTYHYGDVTIRFTDSRETNEFDVDLLRQKYPDIWKECHSTNTRPPHLQIKKSTRKYEEDENSGEPSLEELGEELSN